MLSITTTKTVVTIVEIIWMLTLGRSILIMIFGSEFFKRNRKGEKTAFYPLVNLFVMLEIVGINTYFGILLFIPIVNVFVMAFMSYRLGKITNSSGGTIIGLILLPIVFYPMVMNKKDNTSNDYNYMDSVKNENVNLITQTELDTMNNSFVDNENNKVDSVFKSKAEMIEQTETYRAARIDEFTLNRLKENQDVSIEDDELFKPIKAVDQEEFNREMQANSEAVDNNMFIKQTETFEDNVNSLFMQKEENSNPFVTNDNPIDPLTINNKQEVQNSSGTTQNNPVQNEQIKSNKFISEEDKKNEVEFIDL